MAEKDGSREGEEWRFIEEEVWGGAMNMALDVSAAETAVKKGVGTIRVYRWEPSTLSLGSNQEKDTIDWGYLEEKSIDVTRRPTGGGAIFHENYGDISYSIIAPASRTPDDLLESYRKFLSPIFDAFQEMGVEAGFTNEEKEAVHSPACYLRKLHPSHDIVVEGEKISGNAQYRPKDAVVQHGSIKYEVYPDEHLSNFSEPECTPEKFAERVTSITEHSDVERAEAVDAIEDSLKRWKNSKNRSWRDKEIERARELCDEKFGNERWIKERN